MKRTRIVVETERLLSVSRRRRAFDGWCDGCNETVRMVCAEEAAMMTGIGLREVCRRVEADQLHFNETSEGRLFICLNSLLNET